MVRNKKTIKIVIGVLCAVLAVVITTLTVMIIKPASDIKKQIKALHLQSISAAETSGDKIHFLNVGSSDAILLESNGKFAMIDAGEDTDNPRGFADLDLDG